MGEGRWVLAVQVVAAMLAVAPKEQGLVGVGVPKGLGGLEVCMWGHNGRLGRMVKVWGTPKSSELLRRLPLGRWIQTSRLVVMGGVVDGLRRLGVGTSVEFIFLFLDEGAFAHPMPLVLSMDAAVWNFLPSAGVVSAASVGPASVGPPSSVIF